MIYEIGQCVIGCITFSDGVQPSYNRPYLIIDVNNSQQTAVLLTISSSFGKEHKLLKMTNILLSSSVPPLIVQSFVKVDSAVNISFNDLQKLKLMANGSKINHHDLTAVLEKYETYLHNVCKK